MPAVVNLALLFLKPEVMKFSTDCWELLTSYQDDRFIAKELSRPELQTMETFAPAYFDHMLSAVSADVSPIICFLFQALT
jgi:hypothetical protein